MNANVGRNEGGSTNVANAEGAAVGGGGGGPKPAEADSIKEKLRIAKEKQAAMKAAKIEQEREAFRQKLTEMEHKVQNEKHPY
ncbi:hypothetical protein GOP47_0003971 [Adiantum capillus-veneris]|uniref:Uncharacterized protein n=1 Tax=Adiantum capillus-veneris TaxID=13818 RepID=A0A9D4V6Z2_ADICA|nr:hypothetical protein GOP47_0003971 [Adiantum capillus-veneris]